MLTSKPAIQVIQPQHVAQAKRVICTVVNEIFKGPPTPEQVDQLLATYESRGELDDITDYENHYLKDEGLFLVLVNNTDVVGTGAIRKLDSETAELKRMWFLPPYRGYGLGRVMAENLLDFARSRGL